jgi:hypothetical protein
LKICIKVMALPQGVMRIMSIINRIPIFALLILLLVAINATPALATNVDPGQLITVTGPSNPNPTLETYIYQWEAHQGSLEGTDITSTLQNNGVTSPTNQNQFIFNAPVYSTQTDLYIKLSVYAVKYGGTISDQLSGCSDTQYVVKTINAAGCGLVSGPSDGASACSGTTTTPGTVTYSYTGATTGMGFQWYMDQNNPATTAISGATGSSVTITLASGTQAPYTPYKGQYYITLAVSKTSGTGTNYALKNICTRALTPVPAPTASIT